jgi:glycine cleavage system T protein (aminomethyltransferase)
MSDTAVRSPIHSAQERIGGTFDDWDGWLWTTGFGDRDGEYRAVREGVGAWDVSALIKWDFRGPDALVAADRLLTNDVLGLVDGQVRYGAMVDADGRFVDDGTVYRFAADHVWVMTNVFEMEEHFALVTGGLDVAIECVVHELPLISIQGPLSRDLLVELAPSAGIDRLGYFRFTTEPVEVAGISTWVSRTGVTGELGYELFCRPDVAEALWEALTAPLRAKPVGFNAIDVLRIESGIILPGYDYTPGESTPYDVSFDRLVQLNGRDFLGRDALARIATDPPRRLVGLRIEGDEPPEAGAEISREGRPIGVVTSPTDSPAFGSIALGVVETADAGAGPIEVEIGDERVAGFQDRPAVYDPEKRRPRG